VAALELSDPKLVEVMRGCTTVVQLIGTMRKRFASGDTYETSDIGTSGSWWRRPGRAARSITSCCSPAWGAGAAGRVPPGQGRSRALVTGSGLAFTIFRPSAFEDREGVFVPGMGAITRLLGLKKYQPIKLAELASAILFAATERSPLGVALEGGPLWDLVAKAPRE